ncbi:polymorphic toxin-type HINT domain-containing protein, partial [Streptomyces sp. AB3(2024)]|uniref:polymorphic toxin-type HINT domain-containing protein n=1 Tax=Streptomyces sp. AB3(2024) TaxID=3317321 RepID=UPI0035A29B96
AAGGAALASANARKAANAAASDRGRAAEARQRAEEARNAARDALRAAEAADHAGVASDAAGDASDAAKSASANANAAAGSAEKAGRLANAAGAGSKRAQAAADQARRQAKEADRAATASTALARQASQAAYQARDAARSAATHAQNAATAADQAAEHAGESATSAAEATRQAETARTAAASASTAVTTASTVYDLARRTEAEDLAAATAAAVTEARALKAEEDEATGGIGTFLADWKAHDQEAADLAAEAARPDADTKALAAKGRKAALRTVKTGDPWSQEAAQPALSGTDAAVVEWLRTGRHKAELDDMRQSVREIAEDSPDEAVRTAATAALKGDAQQVEAFFTTGQHEAAVADNRIRVYQLIATGGTSVKESGEKALRDGSPKAVAAFLTTGQYTARQIDERVQATQLLAAGGPEVQAAATFALAGTPETVTSFLQTGRYTANRKDQLAATHAAQMSHLIAEAAQTAAKAQQDAWEATEAAAVANNAAGEAETARTQASSYAAQAGRYAADAKTSAQNAEASATRASESATTARNASQAAARDAGKATASATRARASAKQARQSAASAREAANSAYASARAAGQDATAAQKAADEAWTITAEKMIKERRDELAAGEEDVQAQAAQIEEELKKELEALIQEEINKAEYEYWQAKNPPCPNKIGQWGEGTFQCMLLRNRVQIGLQQNSLLNLLGDLSLFFDGTLDKAQLLKMVMKSILGVDSAEECIKQRSASACAELAINFFPAGKAVKLAKLGKEIKNAEDAARASRFKRIMADCRRPNSFPAGTSVLMADGTTLPIEQIRVGDQVRATDPETGKSSGRRVDATIHTPDDRDFTDLTITSESGATATITTTDHHPFWADNQHAWRDASDLTPDDTLRTDTGPPLDITATRHWTTLQPAYNLTVDTIHTYYVLAGDSPVLVHNAGGPCLTVPVEDVDKAFHPATFDSAGEQFLDHYKRWGDPAGMTQQQYFDAASALARRLSQRGGAVGWTKSLTDIGFAEDGLKGFKYVNPNTGELLITSLDGRIVTYHP